MHGYLYLFTEENPRNKVVIDKAMDPYYEPDFFEAHKIWHEDENDYKIDHAAQVPDVLWDYWSIYSYGIDDYNQFHQLKDIKEYESCFAFITPNDAKAMRYLVKTIEGNTVHYDYKTRDQEAFDAEISDIFHNHPDWYLTCIDYHY